ncbi:dihydrodipicolinate synthase family protein [Halobacteriales archaeon QH_7_69_31]|nr:MAG: dihydrodipicolinate synthase family protein [Halobacteriales archaeon QH_7_69_31]
MEGIGPPLVTPFDESGDVDHDRLREVVAWVEARGVDFLVPCGSNSEAELMTADERAAVVETVVDAASVPVGADAAMIVTPFYYDHDQAAIEAYYREVADASPLPVYLYAVPTHTGVRLEPATVGRLAGHPSVVGMKDSSGDLAAFLRTRRRTADAKFDLLVGSGGLLAQALSTGGTGGVLGLANLAPAALAEVTAAHEAGDATRARRLNAALVELNRAVTAEFGVPGLKWAMRERGVPAGRARSPHRPPDADARDRLGELLAAADLEA